jgi:ribosomal protein S18 acetylase RimI-like enzyme
MSVIYRETAKGDLEGMARIRAAERGEQEGWEKYIWGYLQGEVFPQKALRPRVLYTAVEDNLVVGFIAGHLTRRYECDGELQWINVVQERRGSGIAAELLRLLAAWFVEQKALKICVDVQPANTVARKFYRRHGAIDLNPHWLVWNDIRVVLQDSGKD